MANNRDCLLQLLACDLLVFKLWLQDDGRSTFEVKSQFGRPGRVRPDRATAHKGEDNYYKSSERQEPAPRTRLFVNRCHDDYFLSESFLSAGSLSLAFVFLALRLASFIASSSASVMRGALSASVLSASDV